MDGIDEYIDDPMHWASLVVLDHVDREDPEQLSEFNLHKVLVDTGAYEFIVENFAEEGFGKPSKEEIVCRVLDNLE